MKVGGPPMEMTENFMLLQYRKKISMDLQVIKKLASLIALS